MYVCVCVCLCVCGWWRLTHEEVSGSLSQVDTFRVHEEDKGKHQVEQKVEAFRATVHEVGKKALLAKRMSIAAKATTHVEEEGNVGEGKEAGRGRDIAERNHTSLTVHGESMGAKDGGDDGQTVHGAHRAGMHEMVTVASMGGASNEEGKGKGKEKHDAFRRRAASGDDGSSSGGNAGCLSEAYRVATVAAHESASGGDRAGCGKDVGSGGRIGDKATRAAKALGDVSKQAPKTQTLSHEEKALKLDDAGDMSAWAEELRSGRRFRLHSKPGWKRLACRVYVSLPLVLSCLPPCVPVSLSLPPSRSLCLGLRAWGPGVRVSCRWGMCGW